MLLQLLALTLALSQVEGNAIDKRINNGMGITPVLGWNSWNEAACNSSTAGHALATAKAFETLGLKQLGYTYVNIDDCWGTKNRNSEGNLAADPVKWPNGIKAVADEIHSMGLKFGLYGCSGTKTCAGYPGSLGYEDRDADTLASWGVDYWKYDNCNTPGGNSEPRYVTMHDALKQSHYPILFSLCQWGRDEVWTWAGKIGNSWRATGDVHNTWASVAAAASFGHSIAAYGGPGGFNDWDMMQIGNGVLTEAEERAQFGLWAIGKSPILLGTDLSKLSTASLKTIKNEGIISIHQDKLGKPASYFQPSGKPVPVAGTLYPYWSGELSDGVVIGLVAVDGAATLSANFKDVPGLSDAEYHWQEMYTNTSGKGKSVTANLAKHDMAVFKITVA